MLGISISFNAYSWALWVTLGVPKDHMNIRIPHAGSETQRNGDTKNDVFAGSLRSFWPYVGLGPKSEAGL